jgi:sodium pump decarboxylase gamma subunit
MSSDWGVAGNVVFSGLVIVFFILIMLILLVTLMGKALTLKKAAPPSVPAPAAVPVPAAVQPVAAPQAVAAGDGGEVIAVISAAVSAYMEETAPGAAYAITGITPRPGRVKDTRPAWGFAGMRQNTEPF